MLRQLLLSKVNNNFVLSSGHCREVLSNLLRCQFDFLVDTGRTPAKRGAIKSSFFASTVIIIAVVLTVASFLQKVLSLDFHKLRLKGIGVNLFGLLNDKLSNVFILVIVKTSLTPALRATFSIGLKTRAMESETVGGLALAASLSGVGKGYW